MRKLLLLLGASMLFMVQSALAQTKEVTGKVTDDKGVPVAGATVQEKSTKKATTTDADGNFKLTVKDGATLVVTYVGFERREMSASGSNLTISLKANNTALNEVVVTALGIKREKKALGYSVATVDKKALELRPDGDVVRLLNGKAPGVDILNASGMSGSGTNITIRGVSSINGSSTPLFIVDGVPFDAQTTAQAGFQFGNATSSRFLDLDPNNIENISVLKGLSATTLYGELGRNGVVVVTTKNGSNRKANKKAEISVTQSLFSNTVANLPEYQQSYGGGFDQSLGLAFFSNWGAKFTDPPTKVTHPYNRAALAAAFPELQTAPGNQYEYKPYNSVERFFRTGTVKTTSINVASGGFNVNYTYMDDKGFTPGNRLLKNTFGIGGNTKLANNFSATASINYAVTDLTAPPTGTSFGSNPTASSVFGNLIYTPIAVDLIGLPWENPLDKSSVYYRGGNDIQNPIWTVNNSFTGQKVNRIFGSVLLKYDLAKNLNLSYRVGLDNYTDYNFLSQNKGGVVGGETYQLGLHRTVTGTNTIWNHDFLLDWNKDIAQDLNFSLNAGVNSQERLYQQSGQRSYQQLVYGLFDHDNFIVHDNVSEDGRNLDYKTETQSIGVFAQGTFAYKEYAYLTLGGRNSWTSNLEKNNRSLFYPSASLSFIPTSAIAGLQNSKAINYLKLRVGYATSANFGFPYSTRPNLSISTNVFSDRTGTILNANSIGNRLANPDLKAELLGELEAGIEGKFINNRLSLDLTFYQRISKDQILDRNLDPSSGFTVTSINAGNVRNRGIEMALGYTVVRSKNWRWQLDANFTRNRSLVYGLPSDVKQVVIDGFTNEGLFAINDQPLGIIKGSQIQRDPKTGQRIVDGNGNYLASTEIGILGDPTPDFKLTGISTLGYKGFSFRMQWDYTQGGDMLAYTPGTVVGRGLSKDTDFDRLQGFILPGVKQDGTPNNIQISASQAYFNNLSGFFGGGDLITFDATVIRLREASLSYALPESLLAKTPFGGISFTFSGQNLFYNAPNFPKYVNFDPETSSLGVSNVRGLEYLSGPTSRRFGGSFRITF
jgi:TonB-linked SusC/RagA family outer membrane protein